MIRAASDSWGLVLASPTITIVSRIDRLHPVA
jgi:hypothetical protein